MTRGLFSLMIAFGGLGCTQARYVHKTESEGVVAVSSNSDMWPMKNRAKALGLIRDHVGADYEIVEESEVVTGRQTLQQASATQHGANPVGPRSVAATGTTTTVPVTEYQIRYRKKAVWHRGGSGLTDQPQHLTPEKIIGGIL